MTPALSIAISNSIIREGLRRIFTDASFEVVESVCDLKSLDLSRHAGADQHLLVIERDLLQPCCAEVLEDIQTSHANLRIVVLTNSFDFEEMVSLYAAGAYAYFPDQIPYLSLVAILQMVANGQKVAPPEVIEFLVNLPSASRRAASRPLLDGYGFRHRELRVLELLALGQPNKAIARDMAVNEAAVKAAVKAILRKLGVENRTQAAVMARELLGQNEAGDDSESAFSQMATDDSPKANHPPFEQASHEEIPTSKEPTSSENRNNRAIHRLVSQLPICFCYFQAVQMVFAS